MTLLDGSFCHLGPVELHIPVLINILCDEGSFGGVHISESVFDTCVHNLSPSLYSQRIKVSVNNMYVVPYDTV